MDGTVELVDISKLEYIPSGMFKEFEKLFAKNGEEKVVLLADSSYHTQRIEQMSKEQTEEYKYPCIDNVTKKGELSCVWYSNNNTKGHFKKPKIVFGQRKSGVFADLDGEYGLTQHGYGIVDKKENIVHIEKAMLNPDFLKIMNNVDFANMRYNYKAIALFRKDWWKQFQ